jgi:hypothetical protein
VVTTPAQISRTIFDFLYPHAGKRQVTSNGSYEYCVTGYSTSRRSVILKRLLLHLYRETCTQGNLVPCPTPQSTVDEKTAGPWLAGSLWIAHAGKPSVGFDSAVCGSHAMSPNTNRYTIPTTVCAMDFCCTGPLYHCQLSQKMLHIRGSNKYLKLDALLVTCILMSI